MNLVIDIGNTRVKAALFKGVIISDEFVFSKTKMISNLKNIKKRYKISGAIISSVASISEKKIARIKNIFPLKVLNHQTKVPFDNKYKTPHTLGVDRIALIAAAVMKYPKENVLVIDAGTCITYDFVNDKGEYYGGAISPGLQMRYKSLHTFTANLPLLKPVQTYKLIGDSTKNAIQSGIINGVLREIEGVINQYKQKNKNLTIVLTGGDTYFLSKRLKSSIFANPNFLLEGLNYILTYNIKND